MKKFATVVFGMVLTAGILFGGFAYGEARYERGVLDGRVTAIEEMTAEYAKYENVIKVYDDVEDFMTKAENTIKTAFGSHN